MGIDRLYEDDAPDVARDSPAERDTPIAQPEVPADTDADRTAFNLKYRADVDAVYQAAWDEALPAFQQTWKEHEERYPHTERSRPTVRHDGSWHNGGNRELDAEQNAKVDRAYDRFREIGRDVVLPVMERIEGEDPERRLAGLQNFLKEADRLKEKVAGDIRFKGYTAEKSLENVKDAVRFTFVYSAVRYAESVYADCARLEAHCFKRFDRQNSWQEDQYKGINSRWREPESGLLFEVQFHTQASFDAKELTHRAYERLRGSVADDAERGELEGFQSAVSAKLPIPPGATEIEDYSPPEERDG